MAASPPASHPYHPPDAAIPGYAPNETPVAQLLAVFGAVVVAVCGAAYGVAAVAARDSSSRSRTRLRPVDRFAVVWFALCKCFALCAVERGSLGGANQWRWVWVVLQAAFFMLPLKVSAPHGILLCIFVDAVC